MGHNREKFGALLKSIIGNFKSIIGSGLIYTNIIMPALCGFHYELAISGTTLSLVDCHDVVRHYNRCEGVPERVIIQKRHKLQLTCRSRVHLSQPYQCSH